jgi:hypothetical protein
MQLWPTPQDLRGLLPQGQAHSSGVEMVICACRRGGGGRINKVHNMKTVRIGLHSLILVIADIAGIAAGALAAFKILGVSNQVWLQLPIAVVLSVGCFCAWVLSLRILRWKVLQPAGSKELRACLVASLLWAPVVFVPLHYFTQGYLTSIGNLVALALYQLPVNALALFGPRTLRRSSSAGCPQPCAALSGASARPPDNSGVTERPPSVS